MERGKAIPALQLASTDLTCSRLFSKSSTSGCEGSFSVSRIAVEPVSGEASAEGIESDSSSRSSPIFAVRLVATSSGTPDPRMMSDGGLYLGGPPNQASVLFPFPQCADIVCADDRDNPTTFPAALQQGQPESTLHEQPGTQSRDAWAVA
jgi:hypothetical protein